MKKIVLIFGTRPEAIKMAPVVRVLEECQRFTVVTVVTAQHREMLDQVLQLFQINPRYDLDIMKSGQSLTAITARVLEGLDQVLAEEVPDLVLVHGDTTTTFAAGLAAFYRKIPVGHVEAGLRTGLKYSPYPEELNRKLTGCLADLHFAPTVTARDNLLREGIPAKRVVVTGNTVIDALQQTVKPSYRFENPLLNNLDYTGRRIILLTAHRRENLGEPMEKIFRGVRRIVAEHPEVEVVFPVHLNPKVQGLAREILGGLSRIHLIEPLDYEPFANLLNRCYLVLTDSGGIQEEAPSLGKPVLVLRDTTERPEAVAAGTVKLVGTSEEGVASAAHVLLRNNDAYRKMATAVNPYGDGQASYRILEAIEGYFRSCENSV